MEGKSVPTPSTVIFDFVNKRVVTVGSNPESDRRYQEFVAQQQSQAQLAPTRGE